MDSSFVKKGLLFVLVLLCAQALMATTVNIYLVPGPNNNSPSYNAFVNNMLLGVATGTPQGNPATDPAAWAPVATLNATYFLDTFSDFNSWEGIANPGGAFSGEWGTDLYAAVDINGDGSQVSLAGLNFSVDLGALGFSSQSFTAADNYRSDLVGYVGGLPTVTSGSATQMVDEIRYVGVATFFPITCPACTPAQQQSNLNDSISQIFAFGSQGVFHYEDGAQGIDATTSAQFVPEPSTITLALLGLGAVLYRKHRRTA